MSKLRLTTSVLLLTVLGAALVLVFAGSELLGWGYPGLGKLQLGGMLLGLVLIGTAHLLAAGDVRPLRSPDVPWAVGLAAGLVVAAVVGWAGLARPSVRSASIPPDINERLLAVERSAAAPRRTTGRCLPASTREPIPQPELQLIASGLQKPIYVATPGGGDDRLFVVEKGGTIQIVENGQPLAEPFLDIRTQVISDDRPPASWEQGLLGIAFPPDFSQSGRFYVHYTAVPDGTVTISRFRVSEDPNRAERESEEVLLAIPKAGPDHNGGQLQFGPDGYLYIGLGDGDGYMWPHGNPGVYGDGAVEFDDDLDPVIPEGRDYTEDDMILQDPWKQSQDLSTLRGKILRLDVSVDSSYAVPADNPFAEDDDAATRSEIWAYGFRNPWRFSFDPCDGGLFVGDVGRSSYEEIDLVERGGNYGWSIMEAGHCNPGWGPQTCSSLGLVFPIAEYKHLNLDPAGGNAVIGGYVYRGRRIPSLLGNYVFGDFMSSRLWTLRPNGLTATGWEMQQLTTANDLLASFGVDASGELLVVGYGGTIYRLVAALPAS